MIACLPVLVFPHLGDVDPLLSRGLHEAHLGPHLRRQLPPLLLRDHARVLQVALVAHQGHRGIVLGALRALVVAGRREQ